jgi:hypothetical protein
MEINSGWLLKPFSDGTVASVSTQCAGDKASAVPGGREESKAEDLDLRVYFNGVTPDFNNGNLRALIKAFKTELPRGMPEHSLVPDP